MNLIKPASFVGAQVAGFRYTTPCRNFSATIETINK